MEVGCHGHCSVDEQEKHFRAFWKEVVDREDLNGNKQVEQSIDAIRPCRRHLSDDQTTLEEKLDTIPTKIVSPARTAILEKVVPTAVKKIRGWCCKI